MPYFYCPMEDCIHHDGFECEKGEVRVDCPYDDSDDLVCLEYEPMEEC